MKTATVAMTSKDLLTHLRRGRYIDGGYPTYFLTSDGGVLSHAAVRENLKQVLRSTMDQDQSGWAVVAVGVNWEDPELYCDHTSERIESAYAEAE